MNQIPPDGRAAQWSREPLLDAISRTFAAMAEPLVTPDELRRLQQEGMLDMAEQGELSTAELTNTIREWRANVSSEATTAATATVNTAVDAMAGAASSSQSLMLLPGGPLPNDAALARRYAVSRVLAAELAADLTVWERVDRFRHEALGGGVLAWEAVEGWVEEQGRRDGSPGYWLSGVPISDEQVARGMGIAPAGYTSLSLAITAPLPSASRSPAQNVDDGDIGRLERRPLVYLLPGRANPRWTFVAVDGVLNRLRQLSDYLASEAVRPWWSPAQAATHILTNLAPFVAIYKGLDYVIDPLLPLNQIVEQVAQLRRGLIGERAREMDSKHLHLAVFAAERPEEPWDTRRGVWNATYPQWEYPDKQKSNFIRDSLAAKRRLLLQERQETK